MPDPKQYMLFGLDNLRIALPTANLLEVTLAAQISPVTSEFNFIEGVFNYRGRLIALLDIRARLNLPAKLLEPEQYFLILQVVENTVAIRVDSLFDIITISAVTLSNGVKIPDNPSTPLMVKLADEILAICDLQGLMANDVSLELLALNESLASVKNI